MLYYSNTNNVSKMGFLIDHIIMRDILPNIYTKERECIVSAETFYLDIFTLPLVQICG